MKKLMTSTIILLPLLILAIMLVSGAIMGLVTYIHVDTVEFSDSKAVILVMSDEEDPPTYDLAPEVTVLPLKAPNRDVEFSVADSDLVKVDENGVLTAVFYGETYVTVTSADNTAVSAQRKVIVTDSAVHKVEIGSYKDEMYESSDGEDFGQQLSVSVYPKEAKDTAVEWSSSDESILQVDPNGYVRAVGAGTATVTVKSKSNGDVFATADIKCHTKLRSLAFNGDDNVDVVTSQRECTFPTLKHSPENADITMSYESSDTDIATVDGNGKITFKKEGKVTITATASDFEGHNSISKEKTYTSTDGYYIAPLFEQKSYTFDYDQYNKDSNTPLPIQFATKLEGSYREFKSVEYTIDDVLTFNEDTKQFYFVGEMPIELARTPIEVTVRAMVYDETGVLKEYRDQFTLTVLRNAKSVSVAYRGTADAATILTDSDQFSFAGSGQAAAAVSVSPANHTNALSYSLVGTDSAVATLEGGRLSFKKDGAAKVKIVLSDGKSETVSREVTVIYEKPVSGSGGSVKKVEVPADSSLPAPKVLLSMDSGSSSGKKDEGAIYFTEPEGKTVEYTVETVGGNEGVVEIGTVESGAHRIIPKKGGFAKIIITVSPKQPRQAARVSRLAAPIACEMGGDVIVYTIPVYVDLPVSADDFRITLDGGEFVSQFGTQKNAVPYTFTAANKNGSMEGKQLYVKRGGEKDVLSREDGTIEFAANLSTLEVTFGVEYTSQATGDYQADPNGLMSVTRTVTIHRDATDLAVSYQNVTGTAAIQTSVASLTFRTSDVADGKTIVVTAAPANHTDIIKYTLAGGDSEVASLTGGQLTFKRAGSVTVTISAHREWDDSEVFSKTITVSYAPAGGNVKAFDFSGRETKTEQLLFDAKGETTEAVIYLTVPEAVKPEYKAAENDGVVSLAPEGGLYRIKPAKGGFATVTVTAGDEVYTINIYVDKPVTAEDFNITLDGKPFADAIGTKENAVSYTFTASPENGGMAGKKLFVKYGDPVKIAEGGQIEFSEALSTLEVTFGVEYDEAAKAYGVDGSALTSITRTVTIKRDATGVSVAYRGVDNTTTIQTSVSSLEFLTRGAADENSIIVTVTPATHTDTLEYSLEEGEGIASISDNRTLKFTDPDQAGTVKVKISLKNWKGEEVLAATITVNYAPPKPENKVIDLNEGETYNVLLTMTSASSMDKGEIHLLVPDGSAADYQVEGSDGVVTVTEENGYHYIVPQKGGFATVKVTVTGGEDKVYTINVYVNRRVNSDNIKIKLGGEQAPSSANFDTTLTKVPFEVTVDGEDGCMEGKKLYFYTTAADAKQYHTDDALTYSGEITFENTLSTLTVHFGVEYTEKAKVFKPADGLSSTSRTLERNAETVTVAFNGITTTHIQTSSSVVTFGESGTAKVTVAPVHTDTLKYVLEDEASVAAMSGGRLTFTKEGTVTVKVQLARENGNRVTCEGVTITISYAGAKAGRTLLDFSGKETKTEHLLFDANSETKEAVILLTAPAGVSPDYAETKNGGVIDFRSEGGVYHITAKKGGFAAVTVTAGEKTYTVEIYVDKAVTAENFKVKFDKEETPARTEFGTTLTSVPVNVTVDPADGAMEGKKLFFYVGEKSGEKTYGTDNALTLTGSVTFEKTLSALTVHFGVEYTEETEKFAPRASLPTAERGLARNADSVTVTFGDVQTVHIQTHSANIIFGESGTAKVSVSPETHTDTLKYDLVADSSVAAMDRGTLTFKKEGTVTVKVQLTRGSEVTLEKEIAVDYAPVAGTTKALDFGGESGAQNFLFDVNSDATEAVLFLTEPEGADVKYTVTKGENDVISMTEKEGLHRITAIKGGFATVTVTVTPKTREAVTTYTVEIYVDRAVKTSDFAVQFNGQPWDKADNFLTSLMQVGYSVTVSDGDNDGSLEGKQLYISYGSSPTLVTAEEGTYTKTDTAPLQTGETTFTFGVKYTAKAAAIVGENQRGLDTVTRTVQTSNDKLTASPTVSVSKGQTTLQAADALTFDDIGEEIELTVHGPYTPTDFVLDEGQIKVEDGTQFVSSSVSYLEGNSAKIVLKALKVTGSGGCQISVTIGGQQFRITATVHAKAQTIEVKCGTTVLGSDTYHTFLDKLTFTVTIGRTDSNEITNKKIQYKVGEGSEWTTVDAASGTATFDIEINGAVGGPVTLYFRSADEGASLNGESGVTLEKTTLAEFTIEVSTNDGAHTETSIPLGTLTSEAWDSVAIPMPANHNGTVTLLVKAGAVNLLGGFGTEENFRKIVAVTVTGDKAQLWHVSYEAQSGKIVITDLGKDNFSVPVTVQPNGKEIKTLTFSYFQLSAVTFDGFDIGSSSDVYKGYQQVRVFAKHSTYGGQDVDYFKIPLGAFTDEQQSVPLEDLSWLNWSLVKHDDREGKDVQTVVASQSGYTVTYGGKQYTIDDADGNGVYVLKDGGTVIVGENGKFAAGQTKVTWVDPFSEAGYARIYFGAFGGLSEVDIQNDYFGNFGEQPEWKKVETHEDNYDKSGRNFAPSAGAFTYLRVEAGDGVKGGVNRHFNFNVLAGDDVFNVVDAAGYLAKNKLVLHNDLYGEGEKTDAPAGQILTATSGVAKNTIYGNGYQVNLKAYNTTLPTKNEGTSITFNHLYNVRMMGDSVNSTLNKETQKVYFYVEKVYYCDMSYYFKLGAGKLTCIKNSVFHDVPKVAIQVWNNQTDDANKKKAYIENITIVSCGSGVNLEGEGSGKKNLEVYLKGFFDVLNYNNKTGIANMLGKTETDPQFLMAFPMVVNNAKGNLEWFGSNVPDNKIADAYVNIALYSDDTQFANRVFVVNQNGEYVKLMNSAGQSDLRMKTISLLVYGAATYDVANTVDGGTVTTANATTSKFVVSRDMSKLFTEDRYIRLLCEYITKEKKNDDHILWHMQKVYRDLSLLSTKREENHVEALKQSLINAAKSGTWDGTWPDGSSLNDAIPDAVRTLTTLLSHTLPPDPKHPL